MRISAWVDISQKVDIEIGIDDIRATLTEFFAEVSRERNDGPSRLYVAYVLNDIDTFLSALTDQQIATLTVSQRKEIHACLSKQADRFRITEEDPAQENMSLET